MPSSRMFLSPIKPIKALPERTGRALVCAYFKRSAHGNQFVYLFIVQANQQQAAMVVNAQVAKNTASPFSNAVDISGAHSRSRSINSGCE